MTRKTIRQGAPGVTITETSKGLEIDIKCTKCGEPIIGSDELGMYCKNRCFDKENKEAKKIRDALLSIASSLIKEGIK